MIIIDGGLHSSWCSCQEAMDAAASFDAVEDPISESSDVNRHRGDSGQEGTGASGPSNSAT